MSFDSCFKWTVYRLHMTSWTMSGGFSRLFRWLADAPVIVSSRSDLSHARICDLNNSSAWCEAWGHRIRPPRLFSGWYERLESRIAHLLRSLTSFNLLKICTHVFCASPISYNSIAVMCCRFLWLVHVRLSCYQEQRNVQSAVELDCDSK